MAARQPAPLNPDGTPTGRARMRPHIRRAHWHRYWTGPRSEPDKGPVLMALGGVAARQGRFTPIIQLAIPIGLGMVVTPSNPSSAYRRLVRNTVRGDVSRAANPRRN